MLDWFAWTPSAPGSSRDILLNQFFEFISFLSLLFLLIPSYHWAIRRKQKTLLIVLIIVFAVFGPIMVKLLTNGLEFFLWRKDIGSITLTGIARFTPGGSSVVLFLSAAFYLTHLRLQYAQQREAAHKAETLAKEVQLKMLHYQINPHFLFNLLNSIHALIDENTEKAKKLVVEMAEYYRYTLNKQQQIIPVAKEVEAVVKYLEIQKTRFEEKFGYEISVDQKAGEILIPSFVIHLLIENAVKYGIKSNEQKLMVCLVVKLFNNSLSIRVSNTGRLLQPGLSDKKNCDGTGNGIDNIKSRLSLLYNEHYSFSLNEEKGWVIASIEIENIQIMG